MVEITNPPALFNSNAASSSAEQTVAESDKAVLSSDFETFLKMLTVQVQNQDPLNPVDSTEFATQLATFSSVEQQVLTNDLLRNIGTTLGGNALNEHSRWIGMEGLVRAPVMFEGSAISVRPTYAANADSAQLVVRNANGTEVQRYEIEVGEENIAWGGRDSSGNLLPAGVYRFDIESYEGDSLLSTQMAQVYSRIEEVRNDNGEIMIRLSDGSETSSGLINGLRAPSG